MAGFRTHINHLGWSQTSPNISRLFPWEQPSPPISAGRPRGQDRRRLNVNTILSSSAWSGPTRLINPGRNHANPINPKDSCKKSKSYIYIYIYIHDMDSIDDHLTNIPPFFRQQPPFTLDPSWSPVACPELSSASWPPDRTWTNAIGYQNSKLLGPSPTIWYISPWILGGFCKAATSPFPTPLDPSKPQDPQHSRNCHSGWSPWCLDSLASLSYGLKLSTGKTPQIHKKKDGSNLSTSVESLAMRLHLDESSPSSVTQLTPNTYRNGHRSLGMDENLDHLPPHDTSFQMITLCRLYIHALVHFEVLSHHIKNIHVSYFPALAPLTWMWFRCRSSRATVRFIFKASAKAWRALENNWSFWILPFLLGKAAAKLSLATRLLKDFSSGLAPTNVGKTDHFNLEEWQQNKTCQNSFPTLMVFTVVPKICLAKWYQPYEEHWTTPLSPPNPPKPRYLGTKVSKSRVTQIEQSDTSVHRQCRGHDLHNPRMLAGKCLNQMGVSQALPSNFLHKNLVCL